MDSNYYEDFLRKRITELRIQKNVSEHKMSLELGKSGSYIRSITSGIALPSLRELFNIFDFLDVTPVEFFLPTLDDRQLREKAAAQIAHMDDDDLQKVLLFIDWIK